jgi:hypothetical protein
VTPPNGPGRVELPVTPAQEFKLGASHVVGVINAEMALEPKVGGWLEAGSDRLLACVDEFTTDLGKRAVKLARQRHRTAVDAQDVSDANATLLKIGAESRAYLLALGGLCGGSAIAGAFAIGLSPHVAGAWRWWIVVAFLALVGLVGYVLGRPRLGSGR